MAEQECYCQSFLVHYLESYEECSWRCWAVEISRVAELTLVKVFLETVEDILYSCIQLQVYVVAQNKCVVELHSEVEEIGSLFHTVILDVSCIVWYNHLACICSRQSYIKILEGLCRQCKVAIEIGCSWHTTCGKFLSVDLGPHLGIFISALLCCNSHL